MAMFQYRLNKENIKPTKKRLKIATCPSTPGIILHSVLLSYHQFLAFPSRSLLSESRARARILLAHVFLADSLHTRKEASHQAPNYITTHRSADEPSSWLSGLA